MGLKIAAFAALSFGILSIAPTQSQDAWWSAYDAHQLFEMRAQTEAGPAPPFYKGVLLASANQVTAAEKYLRSVIALSPHANEAYEAHDVMANMFFRNGMYHDSFREIEAALQERPNLGDPKEMLPVVNALNNFPAMAIVSRRPTSLQIEPRSTFLPLKLNGHDAEFFFDTGAGISVIGESEARDLGLTNRDVEGKLGDSSGKGVTGLHIALVKDLTLGGLHLSNVPFLVLSDTSEPWITLPLKRRGIIGIPVLLTMRTINWKPAGSFAFGFPGQALHLATCNTLFQNSNPVIDVRVAGEHLDFTLDTGAVNTDLNPAFARALPALMKTGTPEKQSIEGLGGRSEGQSILLPSVALEFGGRTAVLKPAHVFIEHGNGTWAAGNMGIDVLNQGSGFTLDFGAMTLRLQ